MERYKSWCNNCKERPVTYENEWENGAPKCLRCQHPLENREPFPFVRQDKPGHDGLSQKQRRNKRRSDKKRRKEDGYGNRNAALTVMGYSSYDEYLSSPLWREIRDKIRARDHGKCRACGGNGSEVHHRAYYLQVLEGKALGELVLLCETCHGLIEFDGKVKCTFDESRRRTDALLKSLPLPRSSRAKHKKKRKKRNLLK